MTSNDIESKVKNEVLDTYPQDGISITIPAQDNFAFQLTSTSNELANLQNDTDNSMSVINFGGCENLLKQENNIQPERALIILKYEKLTGVASNKSIQYEVFNPNDYKPLDLSICKNNNLDIDISIPIDVDKEIEDLYNDLKKEGYDLFDRNDKFYIDICTPYQAENGADILLVDRLYYFFSKVVNITTCPSDCKYSTFSIDTKHLTCQCEVNNENIDLVNPDKFLGKILYSINEYALKYTSYKTMKCYNLVFSFNHFIKNAGSIILLIFVIAYAGFFIYFALKGISPLKVSISQMLFDDKNVDNKLNPFLDIKTRNKYKPTEAKSSKGNNPPKKQLILRSMLRKKEEKKVVKNEEKQEEKASSEIDININKKIINSNRIKNANENNNKSEKPKRLNLRKDREKKENNEKPIITNINSENNSDKNNNGKRNIQINASGVKSFYMNLNINSSKKLQLRKDLYKPEKSEVKTVKTKKSKKRQKKKKTNSDDEKPKKVKFNDILESNSSMIENPIPKKDEIMLDDYELNHLSYFEALELDKRNFCRTYYSILKRDQNILSTCFSFNDYNLFYVKMAKFIFVIANLMAMNAFLFADKSFHKLFISGVHYYFGYQILQIFLSVVITYVIEVILCFLTMTDRHIYEIKSLHKKGIKDIKIFNILKCIRNKLLIFFVTALVILIFYWYLISAFCAVYPNTQKIYIIDCLLSFIFFSLFPFILYFFTTLFRVVSLRDIIEKRYKCMYIVGQSFPIF